VENLEPAILYEYLVIQGSAQFSAEFKTAPGGDSPIRFIIYADPETEPESTGEFTDWPDPVTGEPRPCLVDQTTGTRNNTSSGRLQRLKLIRY
jgi:hypothetical protein